MKFSISSSELLKQLQIAVGTISSNPSSAIMEGFLFSIQDSVLTISATDNETAISTEMDVMADFNGKVAIPGKIRFINRNYRLRSDIENFIFTLSYLLPLPQWE